MQHEPGSILKIAMSRIEFLLQSPHTSDWLKTALRAADGHNAVLLQNDLAILHSVFAPIAGSSLEDATFSLSVKFQDHPR